MSAVQPLLRIVFLKIAVGFRICCGVNNNYDILNYIENLKFSETKNFKIPRIGLPLQQVVARKVNSTLTQENIQLIWWRNSLFMFSQTPLLPRIAKDVCLTNPNIIFFAIIIGQMFFVEICFLVINDNITEHFRKYFLEILKGFMTWKWFDL